MKRIILLCFIISTHFVFGQVYKTSKAHSRYNFNYIQLQSNIKKNIAILVDASFVRKHFNIKESLKFDLQVIIDEKGNLKNDQTIVYSNSDIFNKKVISTFDNYPQLLPEEFPFSTKEFEYQVLTKLEYIVNDSYRLVEVDREELWRNISIDIHPSEKKIIEYVKNLQSDGWEWSLDKIKIPIYFTLNSDYKLSNIIIFSDSEFIENRISEYMNDINNCFFYIALDTNKNYSATITLLAHKSQKSFESYSHRNIIDGDYYAYSKSETESFPVFPFCSNNNLIDEGGICFLYAFEEFIYTNIDQNIIKNINGAFPLKAKIKFIIDSSGNISDIKVNRSKKILKDEILKILQKFPQIEPGRKWPENKPIDIYFAITMVFYKDMN